MRAFAILWVIGLAVAILLFIVGVARIALSKQDIQRLIYSVR